MLLISKAMKINDIFIYSLLLVSLASCQKDIPYDFDAAENLLERFISSENTAIVTQGGPLFLNNLVAATRQRGMKPMKNGAR